MSDCVVGFTHFSSRALIEPTSSGADQRTDPPLVAFEPLTEYMSSAIEERPKSVRQGSPDALIRILYYKRNQLELVIATVRVMSTNTLQVTVNNCVSM